MRLRKLFAKSSGWLLILWLTIPAHATFPGKNGRIAFLIPPDAYTMNPDGSDVRQLTKLGARRGGGRL